MITLQKARHVVESFITTATPARVANRFSKLDGARRVSIKDCSAPAVYVPGTREDRVLLVAHSDTVWDRGPSDLGWDNGGTLAYSLHKKVGIGADDRAGCAALWLMQHLGHSLLICPDEEVGCVGSTAIALGYEDCDSLKDLADHRFAIQFDRRGSHDIVTYDCDNEDFDDWLLDRMPGYAKASGSYSDIAALCPTLGIAAANISIGFYDEHRPYETLDLLDFYRTVVTMTEVLSSDCPKFEYVEKKWSGRFGYASMYDYDYVSSDTKSKSKSKSKSKGKPKDAVPYDIDDDGDFDEQVAASCDGAWCDKCQRIIDIEDLEIDGEDFICPCGEVVDEFFTMPKGS